MDGRASAGGRSSARQSGTSGVRGGRYELGGAAGVRAGGAEGRQRRVSEMRAGMTWPADGASLSSNRSGESPRDRSHVLASSLWADLRHQHLPSRADVLGL